MWHGTCDPQGSTWTLSGGAERGTNERPGIWSCDQWRRPLQGKEMSSSQGTDTNTHRQTDRQTDGHRDSMTESAQWANSVKSHHNKDNCVIFSICAVLRKTSRTNPISGCWSKYSTSFFETTTRTFHSTGRLSISNVRNALKSYNIFRRPRPGVTLQSQLPISGFSNSYVQLNPKSG